jgi:hypothetical protein
VRCLSLVPDRVLAERIHRRNVAKDVGSAFQFGADGDAGTVTERDTFSVARCMDSISSPSRKLLANAVITSVIHRIEAAASMSRPNRSVAFMTEHTSEK